MPTMRHDGRSVIIKKSVTLLTTDLKSIRFHLRPPIALEASLCKSLSLNQLAKIFVAIGIRGDKPVAD